MIKKIILFGGTFDPIHLGHITVADYALKNLGAEKLIFIPAKRSPHKSSFPEACDQARLEMLRLAAADRSEFEVSSCELKRAEPSYSLNTIRSFRKEYGSSVEICWLVGADAITDLARWFGICELIDECSLCVMLRGGVRMPDFTELEPVLGLYRIEKLRDNVISTPLIEVSSTEIRSKIARNETVEAMLDEKVRAYIEKKGLYKALPNNA